METSESLILECISEISKVALEKKIRSGETRYVPPFNHEIKKLIAFGELAVSFLIKVLEDPDSVRRAYCAKALGYLRPKSSLGRLVTLLGDSDAEVRAEAAFALGRIADPIAIPALLKVVGKVKTWHFPDDAVIALLRMRGPELTIALQDALNSGDEELAKQASEVKRWLSSPALEQFLKNDDDWWHNLDVRVDPD